MMDLAHWFAAQPKVVMVKITQKDGSAPRGTDAKMFVSDTAIWGTIGGGVAEYTAIRTARDMLCKRPLEQIGDEQAVKTLDLTLGPQTGQCCGGRISLQLQVMGHSQKDAVLTAVRLQAAQQPMVLIFGAGHVGRALAQALLPLPLRAQVFDARADQIALLPHRARAQITALPEAAIDTAPAGSAYVIATHDHGLDFALTERALARGDAAYVGMIGSGSKRAQFIRYAKQNAPQTDVSNLICPIGALGVADKSPQVIAAQLAVELLLATGKQM